MNSSERLIHGKVVTPTEIVEKGTVVVRDGVVVDIDRTPRQLRLNENVDETWILPGMIDTHSDAIETEIQPRPGSRFPMEISFHELERKLAAQGITTMYHSLSMFAEKASDWARENETVQNLLRTMRELMQSPTLIRHRLHLRFEITNVMAVPFVEEMIRTKGIDQLSFMDHSPGQGQYRSLEHQRQLIMAMRNISSSEADEIIMERREQPKVAVEDLRRLAALAAEYQIRLASHDDDSIAKLDVMRDWNVAISEFPVELKVAIEAKRRNLAVVMGAPNVVLGKSHSNNVSAYEAIQHGAVDILCSDYYPPSMLQAVFLLYRRGMSMVEAAKLVSLNPAKALGLNETLGSIEVGKTADLLMVRERRELPTIQEVYVDGRPICQMTYHTLDDRGSAKGGRRSTAWD